MAGTNAARAARYWIGRVHLWTGLLLGAPLALLGLTGSALLIADAVADWRSWPPHAAPSQHPVAAIVAAARAAAPEGLVPTFYVAPTEGGPAVVRLVPRAGPGGAGGMRVEVHPATLGATPVEGGLQHTLHLLHANLMLEGEAGRKTVGWLGVAMLVLGASGLVNWWPPGGRWRAAFTVRRYARGAALYRDLHGAVGIWAFAGFLAVVLSGVALAFPPAARAVVDLVLPARDLRATAAALRVAPEPGRMAIGVDEAVATALAGRPPMRVASIGLPTAPDRPFRINLARPDQAHGTPLVSVFVDPWRAKVAAEIDPAQFTAGETILAWQHAIHAGDGFGPVWRLAVGVVGLLPPLFAATGTAMWWLRRRRAARLLSAAAPDRIPAPRGLEP